MKDKSVEVRLQVLLADALVRPFDTPLHVRPEILYVIHVHIAAHILFVVID